MKKFFGFLILSILMNACSEKPVGSKERPFAMFFVPSVDSEKIATSADHLTSYVKKYVSQKLYGNDEGFHIKSSIPSSYVAVVEAFGTKRADFAALTTFSYILAKDIKKYPVKAVLTVLRNGNETTYKGQIIAHKDSGIKTLADLNGKKFAYTDPSSTSGFLLPSKLLRENGITLGETVFGQKHDNVVTMVYQRQVDAGATYYTSPTTVMKDGKEVSEIKDARVKVKTQFPDVEDKVKIIGFTEEVPQDPWVIRPNLYKDSALSEKVQNLVSDALLSFATTDEGKKALDELYSISGLVKTDDTHYDDVRSMILTAAVNLENIVSGKKK